MRPLSSNGGHCTELLFMVDASEKSVRWKNGEF